MEDRKPPHDTDAEAPQSDTSFADLIKQVLDDATDGMKDQLRNQTSFADTEQADPRHCPPAEVFISAVATSVSQMHREKKRYKVMSGMIDMRAMIADIEGKDPSATVIMELKDHLLHTQSMLEIAIGLLVNAGTLKPHNVHIAIQSQLEEHMREHDHKGEPCEAEKDVEAVMHNLDIFQRATTELYAALTAPTN